MFSPDGTLISASAAPHCGDFLDIVCEFLVVFLDTTLVDLSYLAFTRTPDRCLHRTRFSSFVLAYLALRVTSAKQDLSPFGSIFSARDCRRPPVRTKASLKRSARKKKKKKVGRFVGFAERTS